MLLQHSYTKFEDEKLVAAYKKTANPVILGTLYKRHAHSILGLCLSYLKNYQDSQDAVMDIFEKLGPNLLQYEIKHFESWLYFVCRNHCLKRFQQKLKYRPEDISALGEDFFVENTEEFDPIIEKKLEILSDAIDQLKDHQRKCLILFYLEGKSYKEIERLTPYKLNDIKSYIQNGKRNLRTKILNLI